MQRLLTIWDDLRSSLWFTPAILTGFAIGIAYGVLRVDRYVADSELAPIAWAFSGGADSARQILSTIAGSMITLTGVTFSITLAALTLAAGQYSPRILRNFMRDRFNQTVLGVFIGTFVYSVLVLRSLRGGDEAYVPAVATTGSILLSVISLGFLIFFIHHMANSIQVSAMIRGVARETEAEIGEVFVKSPGLVGPAGIATSVGPISEGWRTLSTGDGFVRRIDIDAIVEAAEEADVQIDLMVGPGDFATRGAAIAVVNPEPGDQDADGLAERINDALFLNRQRSIAQDPAFGFRQIVDIAVKALSPGINDPTTACNAVDALGTLLVRLADIDWPDVEFEDGDGEVRLRVPDASFADYVSLSVTEIRRYGATDLATTLRLLDMLGRVASTTARAERQEALWAAATAIMNSADRAFDEPSDRKLISDQFGRFAVEVDRDPAPFQLESS